MRLSPDAFRFDGALQRQFAGNLVENAVKWGQSTVRIHWQPTTAGGALIIENDGPGIDLLDDRAWRASR